MPVQRRSIDDDQEVQTLTANGADHPLDVRAAAALLVLPALAESQIRPPVSVKPEPNQSRSLNKKHGALSQGNASRSYCAVLSRLDEPSLRNVESGDGREPGPGIRTAPENEWSAL
jgi:hypothetical protein